MPALLAVEALRVVAGGPAGGRVPIVDDVSFSVDRGEVLALIGESGSGKTTIALSLMGYARSGCSITGGRVRLGDVDVLSLDTPARTRLRGRRISYIAQSAAAAFNPAKTIMAQVVECAWVHGVMSKAQAQDKAVALFRSLSLPEPELVGRRYPHQVSGGQLQRLLAAMALITDPELVIFDEPTTSLDVTTQVEVLRAFKAVIRERGATGVYVSHDLAVVAQMADRVVVLRDGRIQETDRTARILAGASHAYTRELLAAAEPAIRLSPAGADAGAAGEPPLLEVRGLVGGYGPRDKHGMPLLTVLDDVDLVIPRGSTVGIIGESGCGKTTLARVIAGLHPAVRGSIRLDGRALPSSVKERTREQLRRVQIVFQMADTALNPAHTVGRILGRPLAFYHGLAGEAQRRRVAELLALVHLPRALVQRHPTELSGGQKQRVNLARALAAEPALILCDEVTSALDTIVGANILDLLAELRGELGVSYMFISHDLATVRAICDQVIVLYGGRKVEAGDRQTIVQPPFHPYSELLISSVPELRMGWLDEVASGPRFERESGPVPPANSTGCNFYERCPVRIEGTCDTTPPPLRDSSKGAQLACHRSERELMERVQRRRPAPGVATP